MSDDVLNDVAVPYRTEAEYQSPYAELADELFRERVLRARRALPENKILAGQRLFEAACEITLLGIQREFPELTEEGRHQILRQRLALRRKLEEQR